MLTPAAEHLASHFAGRLEDDTGSHRVWFIHARPRAAGHPAALILPFAQPRHLRPDQPADLLADWHATLHIPAEGHDAMELHVQLLALDAGRDGHWQDRWQAYHGRPTQPLFLRAEIRGVRFTAEVLDTDELLPANPLAKLEAQLVRYFNAHRTAQDEVIVGVTPDALDIRTRTGPVRRPLAPTALAAAFAAIGHHPA
jgi:hypothetical protein